MIIGRFRSGKTWPWAVPCGSTAHPTPHVFTAAAPSSRGLQYPMSPPAAAANSTSGSAQPRQPHADPVGVASPGVSAQSNPLSDAWAAWIEQLVDDRVHRRLSEHSASPDPSSALSCIPVGPSSKRLSLTRSKPRVLRQQQQEKSTTAHSPQATPRLPPASTPLSDSDDSVEVVVLEDSDSDSHGSPSARDEDGWIDEEHTDTDLVTSAAAGRDGGASNGNSTGIDDDDDASSTSSSSSSATDPSSVSGSSDRNHHHHHPGLTLDRLYRSFRAFKITRERKYAQLVSHVRTVQVLVAQCFLDIEDLKQVTNQLCQHANAQIMSGTAAAGYGVYGNGHQQHNKQTAVVFSGNDQSISASNYSSSTASSSSSSSSSSTSAVSNANNNTPPLSSSPRSVPISPRHQHHQHHITPTSTPPLPIRPVASAVEGSAAALRTLLEQCDDPSLVGAFSVSMPSPTTSAAGHSSSSASSSTSSAMSTHAGSAPSTSTGTMAAGAPASSSVTTASSGTSTMAALAHLLESCSPVMASGKLTSGHSPLTSSSTTRLPISPPRRHAHLTSPSATSLHSYSQSQSQSSQSHQPWPNSSSNPRSPTPKSPKIRVGLPTPLARMAAAANLTSTSSSSAYSSTHAGVPSPSAAASAHFTHPPPFSPGPFASSPATNTPMLPPTPTRSGTAGDAFRKLAPPPPPPAPAPAAWTSGSPTTNVFTHRNASTTSVSGTGVGTMVDPQVLAILNSPRAVARKAHKPRHSPGKPTDRIGATAAGTGEESATGSSPMQGGSGSGSGSAQRLAWPALAEHTSPTQASAAPASASASTPGS
ncbi:hypothetical protein BCR44DRAFT_68636 [Catenaria anguillulae PL171]|uniref:Uncharacterized protein n=1 Tax=Catenaria anguillulae PL171 TaxID=765915 RepID=A0A1Y2HMT7_9FUNG|nr:hypothetical protein BCR44DRAFT_68636 [Catenaria anguillulae PL171]